MSHGNLSDKVVEARRTAPPGLDDPDQIAAVAWVAWDTGRQPEAVWEELEAVEP